MNRAANKFVILRMKTDLVEHKRAKHTNWLVIMLNFAESEMKELM